MTVIAAHHKLDIVISLDEPTGNGAAALEWRVNCNRATNIALALC